MRFAAGHAIAVTLITLGLGALAAACDANLETLCFDGPCAPASTGSTGGTGTGTGSTGGTGGGDTCSDEPADGDFPCDVFDILQAKCHTCHNANHDKGAPIDLLTCSRFHDKDCSLIKARFRVANGYVHSGGMPLPPAPVLSDTQKATMVDWLDGCALCLPAGTGCTGTAGVKACFQ